MWLEKNGLNNLIENLTSSEYNSMSHMLIQTRPILSKYLQYWCQFIVKNTPGVQDTVGHMIIAGQIILNIYVFIMLQTIIKITLLLKCYIKYNIKCVLIDSH